MRTYERTHPWLTFEIDLRTAGPRLWMVLGEIQSKCEHIAGVPLRPTIAQELHRLYLAKGVQATTAIEGNTLSEEDVLRHLEGRLHVPPDQDYLVREIDNIAIACQRIAEQLLGGESAVLTLDLIREFNRWALADLDLEDGIAPGEIRPYSVGVGRYRGAPPEDCEYLLGRLCDWLGSEAFQAPTGLEIVYATLKAVLAHLYLAWIHPFGDGNGRTARLVEFFLLLEAGVPTPAAHLLSNHYNQTRREYYRQLERASQSGGDVIPFVEYAAAGFVEGLKSQLALIRDQQRDVAWRNYVHERFRDKTGRSDVRRRHLALDLSREEGWVAVSKIREISPRVAGAYASLTQKAISRDLNRLWEMGLIEKRRGAVRARRETILAFLPARRNMDGSEST